MNSGSSIRTSSKMNGNPISPGGNGNRNRGFVPKFSLVEEEDGREQTDRLVTQPYSHRPMVRLIDCYGVEVYKALQYLLREVVSVVMVCVCVMRSPCCCCCFVDIVQC